MKDGMLVARREMVVGGEVCAWKMRRAGTGSWGEAPGGRQAGGLPTSCTQQWTTGHKAPEQGSCSAVLGPGKGDKGRKMGFGSSKETLP